MSIQITDIIGAKKAKGYSINEELCIQIATSKSLEKIRAIQASWKNESLIIVVSTI